VEFGFERLGGAFGANGMFDFEVLKSTSVLISVFGDYTGQDNQCFLLLSR